MFNRLQIEVFFLPNIQDFTLFFCLKKIRLEVLKKPDFLIGKYK